MLRHCLVPSVVATVAPAIISIGPLGSVWATSWWRRLPPLAEIYR